MLMAQLPEKFCEANENLHKSVMKARKNRSAIYAAVILVKIKTNLQQITCLPLKDDLRFLTAGSSVLEMKKALEKARNTTLDLGTYNVVIYDISKTEAILFFKA